ncbi:putative amino acid efflux protein [Gordonia rhizosphera NBRC 16068]|uniref:Putative amino acid efflux protein n=2 Tax=Gordonia rhizosphera TaxID=83341 RepID=K6WIJ9_9ACTN|nr:putative amino acid efflux protein [Gordonia rhizosphera NBRC 16068]
MVLMTNRDRLLGLGVVAMWGFNFIAIRLGLDHFPPFFFAALRFAVMAVPVVLFVRFPQVRMRWFLLYAVGFGMVQFAFLFLAMHLGMPTGLASLVLQSSAPFTVLLGVLFLRERMSPLQVVGIAAAVAGMVIIGVDRATHSTLGLGAVVPMILTVLAGLSWAVGNIGSRLAVQKGPARSAPGARQSGPAGSAPGARLDDPLRMTLWMSVVPPIPMFAMSLVLDGPTAGTDSLTTLGSRSGVLALVGLAYVVLLGTIAGSGLWTMLMSRYEASRVAPLSLLVPVIGITAAWLLLGETPTAVEVGGAVIVIVGCAAGVLAAPVNRPQLPPLRSAERVDERRADPIHRGAGVGADQGHVREPVDEAAGAVEDHRHARRLQSVGVGDALVAERVEPRDDHVGRREACQVLGQQR